MYALHFFYGLGALLTPIVSKPFLHSSGDLQTSLNLTQQNLTVLEAGDSSDGVWTIKTLYPIIGLFMLLPIPAFVYYYIEEYRKELGAEDSVEAEKTDNTSSSEQLSRRMRLVLMVFMALFYFTVSGVELGFRGFIAVFCVNSSLAMSRSEAADILAIFYTTFAAVRGLLVPASTLVSSTAILWSSALTLLASTSLLAAWADSSLAVLRAGVALTGAGTAAMFAAGVLWLRGVITVDNKVINKKKSGQTVENILYILLYLHQVTGVVCFAVRVSEQVYSMVSGWILDTRPRGFLYLMAANMVCVISCLAILNIIARRKQ